MSRTNEPIMTKPAPAEPRTSAGVEALTYRMDQLPAALGVSRRTIEAERAAGRFPRPDLKIGRMPLWRRTTIERWLEHGGGKP